MSAVDERGGRDSPEVPDGGVVETAAFEYRPPTASTVVAVTAGLVATVALAATSLSASAIALVGTVVVAAGLFGDSRAVVTTGAGLLFVGVLAAGVVGGRPLGVLVAAVATLVAFDAGQYGRRLGQQVGARAQTRRAEAIHLGVTVAVTAGVALLGAAVFVLSAGQQPAAAVIALLLGSLALLSALASR